MMLNGNENIKESVVYFMGIDKARFRKPVLPGDTLVIHDTGAHGYAMGFNYNGKLRSAELLLREDGSVVQIRRAETIKDYFATLDFKGLREF